ncbi:MAG TPA: flagellar basal body P-ring formation chaperone FlgA [Verrucomicrobiae bacterium]
MNFRAIILLVLVCVGLGVRVSAAQSSLSLELPAQTQVTGQGVFPRDLFGAALEAPHVSLFEAPAFGKLLVLTRAQVETALVKATGSTNAVQWTGAEKVTIARRSRMFGETEMLEMLTQTLQQAQVRERGELELRLNRSWAEVTVPDEPLTMKVMDLPASGISPYLIVRFELLAGRESAGTWQVAVQAKVWREVIVARQAAMRGLPVTRFEWATERRDVLTMRDALTDLPAPAEVLEVAESIQNGATLTARSLRVRPIINRGKVVDALVQNGALEISVKVEVLEDGLPGQTVRVRNLKSKREFRGKVQNEQTILVTL